MSGPLEVLVACSRSEDREALSRILARRGLKPVLAATVEKSRGILAGRPVRLVFCDDELPDGSVGSLLEEIRRSAKRVPVIVISRLENWDEYLRAMRQGAFDYISSPLRRPEVEQVIRRALDELPAPPTPPENEPDGGAGASSSNGRGNGHGNGHRESVEAPEHDERQPKHRSRQKGFPRKAAHSARKMLLKRQLPVSGRTP